MRVLTSTLKSLSLGGPAALALLATCLTVPALAQDKPAPAPAAPGRATITVPVGQSVQAAIDNAPAGSTVVLAKGVHPERVTIAKPITLAGDGWESTTLGPEKARASFTQQQKDDFFKRLEAAADPEQRARIAMEMAAVTQPPTITVKDAADVTISGLRVRGPYTGQPGSVNLTETLLRFENATGAVLKRCAVVGPFSNGVSIVNGSDVRVEGCLVAAVWGTGVQVSGGRGAGAKPAKVHLVDSDIRNCHHRGVTITGEGSVVERSRISGSAWHGIRYDHCSPTIKDNLIFANARSGIYASGKTAARVSGNVFWRNEMDAMSCWFNNADLVEGNTIVGNLREGISVLGDSETKLTRNVIANNPVGLIGGPIAGRNNEVSGTPKPQLVSNVFWGNKQDVEVAKEPKPLPEGNVAADPKFAAPDKHDFSLAHDSPARQLGAGAAKPLPLASPFPIQPGEAAMIPDGETRDFDKWKHAPPAQAAADHAADASPQLAAAQSPPAAGAQGAKAEPSLGADEKQLERQRAFAKMRVRQDQRRYSKADVAAAEDLYQAASKNWRGDDARAAVKTLTEKFPDLNRTGCALLNVAQSAQGEQREQLLKRAAERHGDCFYANGAQVGGLARYLLAHHYREQGKPAEAQRLLEEIRTNYPDAVTHDGKLLAAVLRAEGPSGKQLVPATQAAE